MKFRKHAAVNPETDAGREDVHDLAEALGLFRSAMHHVADREAARRPFVEGLPERHPTHTFHWRLILAPALAAAVGVGVLVPLYSHFHHPHPGSSTVASRTQSNPGEARASIDDSVLMNQIDSELSEDVPDALRPLADLSDQAATANSVSEKKNVTHE